MTVLEINNLSKAFAGKPAVDHISFKAQPGHILGLLGPNGAGKTTTMSMIMGIMPADDGEVLFDGKIMTAENESQIKQKIGFLSEANPLYAEMLVGEYLQYMASLRGMSKEESKQAIARAVKETVIAAPETGSPLSSDTSKFNCDCEGKIAGTTD